MIKGEISEPRHVKFSDEIKEFEQPFVKSILFDDNKPAKQSSTGKISFSSPMYKPVFGRNATPRPVPGTNDSASVSSSVKSTPLRPESVISAGSTPYAPRDFTGTPSTFENRVNFSNYSRRSMGTPLGSSMKLSGPPTGSLLDSGNRPPLSVRSDVYDKQKDTPISHDIRRSGSGINLTADSTSNTPLLSSDALKKSIAASNDEFVRCVAVFGWSAMFSTCYPHTFASLAEYFKSTIQPRFTKFGAIDDCFVCSGDNTESVDSMKYIVLRFKDESVAELASVAQNGAILSHQSHTTVLGCVHLSASRARELNISLKISLLNLSSDVFTDSSDSTGLRERKSHKNGDDRMVLKFDETDEIMLKHERTEQRKNEKSICTKIMEYFMF